MSRAYYWRVVVHFGKEFFQRGIFARGELGLWCRCDWVGLLLFLLARRNERGCGIWRIGVGHLDEVDDGACQM